MTRKALVFLAFVVGGAACVGAARAADVAQPPAAPKDITPEHLKFFEEKIRPVLVEQCYKCHSTKGEKIKGDLVVDSREGLLKGGASGDPSVVPGDPEKSALIKAIRWVDEDLAMPPKKQLPAETVKDFETWVKMGAPDPRVAAGAAPVQAYKPPAAESEVARQFWAFQPPTAQAAPAVKQAAWAKTDIDRFILAKLEAKGIAPVAPADKLTLIRRATFDLTGLPPTPEDVDAFLADESAEAFAKVIDRLLASPAYGERWGRHWMDVARYADSAGDSADYPIPQAYKYRNYVIDAFNKDKPYDRFLREQIAGDLLPFASEGRRKEQIIATGFIATSRRFSVQPQTAMHLTIDDTIDTIGKSVLGLSLSCARCHDHKFDPIPAKDFYSLYGIFSSTRYPFAGSENTKYQYDFVPLLPADQLPPEAKEFSQKLAALQTEMKELRRRGGKDRPDPQRRARIKEIEKQIGELAAKAPQIEDAYAVTDADAPANARIQKRGEPYDLGDEAPRGFLTVLGGQKLPPDAKGSGRLELAGWLTDPKNPLTARVMVNRFWQHHFGRGIVKTPSDFGSRGTPPTHPELLDYLALKFVERGWSIKAMHREIMLSAVYQLSGAEDARCASADPTNDLYWRFERRRLEGEAIRDAMLAVSGDLDRSVPGAHPFPPKDKWSWTQHKPFDAVYDSRHRSVYLMVQRIKRHPFLATFDGPDPNASTADRITSTTPLQALYLMNDKFVHEQSQALASRLEREATDETARVDRAYRLALGRPPSDDELAAATSYLRAFREKAVAVGAAKPDDAGKAALASLCRVLFGSNEFVFVE